MSQQYIKAEIIRKWSEDKGLHKADPKGQLLKLAEETGEVIEAMTKGREEEAKIEIGDVFVVTVILAQQKGWDIEECIEKTIDKIRDRTGEMVNGVFVKSEDL